MKFSVITINYNNRKGLEKTIQSILSQTYRNFEFIVIDGGSTDGSKELIEQNTSHITYWVSEPDKGIYNAMNKGISVAHGELLNFMNSGDIFYNSNVLETAASQPDDYDILVGKDYHVNELTGQSFASILPPRVSMVTFYKETLPHQGAFFKRQLFDNGTYDEHFKLCADWAFYVNRIVKDGCRVRLVQEIFAQREQGGASISHDKLIAEEHTLLLNELLPPGVRADYVTLDRLDRATLYKLFCLCEHPKANYWLTIAIKILNRVFNCMPRTHYK